MTERLAAHGLTPAQIAERVRASRQRQGLPERVVDALALRDIAALLAVPMRALTGSGRSYAA